MLVIHMFRICFDLFLTPILSTFLVIILSVPETELRDWMLQIFDNNMHQGDYVIIYVNQQTPDQSLYNYLTSPEVWQADDGRDDDVMQAYENLFMVRMKKSSKVSSLYNLI